MRAKELKRRLSSQFTKKSKRVENTLELVLSGTIHTWMEIKSPPRLLLIRAKPSVLAKVHDQQTIQKEVTKRNFLTKQ
jgi:hypothetical protein